MSAHEKTTRIDPGRAVLWASAFVLAALVIIQAGKLPGNPAYAEMGLESGGFSLLTTNSGRGGTADPDELLYVIDSRDEVLLVYGIPDARQKQVVLRGGAYLPFWFQNARR
jgi:hypothetical protein